MTTKIDTNNSRDFSSQELAAEELSQIVGGESPKETVTFEYGGLHVQYSQQSPSGTLL